MEDMSCCVDPPLWEELLRSNRQISLSSRWRVNTKVPFAETDGAKPSSSPITLSLRGVAFARVLMLQRLCRAKPAVKMSSSFRPAHVTKLGRRSPVSIRRSGPAGSASRSRGRTKSELAFHVDTRTNARTRPLGEMCGLRSPSDSAGGFVIRVTCPVAIVRR